MERCYGVVLNQINHRIWTRWGPAAGFNGINNVYWELNMYFGTQGLVRRMR